MRRRLSVFEPIASIASADGPTKVRPFSPQARANAAFSARNPYPGWISRAPVFSAAARIAGTDR